MMNERPHANHASLDDATHPPTRHTSLPWHFAQQHQVCLIQSHSEHTVRWVLCILANTPTSIVMQCQNMLTQYFIPRVVTPEVLQEHLSKTYPQVGQAPWGPQPPTEAPLHALINTPLQNEELLAGPDDAPVIQTINNMLSQALQQRASDLHLECDATHLHARIRVDGSLQALLQRPVHWAAPLIARLKIMAKMDIAEKRLPQDGRMRVTLKGHGVDIRVATLPAQHGERMVLRLLDQQQTPLSLDDLGMPDTLLTPFKSLLQRQHGMILLTGPTGSGKTTTLYAALRMLNTGQQNILTIEDPIEYDLPGIGQTATNDKTGYDFTKGLRAILRQDPDVVMVGEIRDTETARIATQASLTGHLLLATLHTHTTTGAIHRLMQMGIEPFFVAHGLVAIINQRLIKKLCPHCKTPHPIDAATAAQHGLPIATILHEAQGCERCMHSGYHGRLAVYECLTVDARCQEMILNRAPESALQQHGIPTTQSMRTTAQTRLLAGEISLSDYLKVIQSIEDHR